MQRDFHFVVRIEGLERRSIAGVIDGVKPDSFRQRRMEHRRVIRLVERPEAWSEGSETLVAINLQVENMDNQGVAGLSALNVKRAGEWLSPLTSACVSPGFLMALPKQSSELESRMFPGRTRATGGATP